MSKPDETTSTETTEQSTSQTPETGKPETPETPGTETPETEVDERDKELPEWARKKLTKANAESANYRTRLREAEAKLAEAKTPEEMEAAIAAFRDTNAKLERQILVRDVADEVGLPKELAARLQGDTREELMADAKNLAKFAVVEKDEPGELRGGLDPSDDEGGFDPVKAAMEARARAY